MEPHDHPNHEQQHQRGLETDRRIDKLAAHVHQFSDEAKLRDAKTMGKLNALIDLMDRHLREKN